MTAGVLMPRSKKPRTESGESDQAAADATTEKKKYTEAVKFTKQFKERLERVAKKFRKWPGQLVEEKLKQFIDQEWYQILEDEMEEARRSGLGRK